MVRLNRKQANFLYFYGADGVSFGEAAEKAGMTEEQAGRFWKRPDVQEWLADMASELAVKEDWERRPAKWYALGDKWLRAPKEEKPLKVDVEIWKEFGDRVLPKQSRNAERGGAAIEIHIDGAVLDYFRTRQKTIDAEVVK